MAESIYSLLAKFAQLNALTNRDLCKMFVMPTACRARSPRFPIVDLRFGEHIRIGHLMNTLGINAIDIDSAFIDTQFLNSMPLSSPNLIWCTKCAHFGFHSAVFQLHSYVICPAHRTPLRRTCSVCKLAIPYYLKSNSQPLFTCSHCAADLAEGLRTHKSALGLSQQAASAHREFSQLIRFLDTLPTLINACKARLGQPNTPLHVSKPDLNERGQAYRQFVSTVLASIPALSSTSQLLPVSPTGVFSTDGRKYVRKFSSLDSGLAEAQDLYRSVKRHIYRHMCRGHSTCIHAGQRALWWDIEGEKTSLFCPTAVAFLRWRMHWEGCRVPSMLDSKYKVKTFTGIVGWLAVDAPIGSILWTKPLEDWISIQLFAFALFDSFAEWQQVMHQSLSSFVWDKSISASFGKRHWACCGRGTVAEPAIFYVEPAYLKIASSCQASMSHIRRTLKLLADTKR
jgi:hypothetical protein